MIQRTKVNLTWLHKMRWAAIAGQLTTIAVVAGVMQIDLPLAKMLAVIAVATTTNLGLGVWLHRFQLHALPAGQGEWLVGWLMMLDNLLLTLLLYYSGGPSNPFTVFYLVNIALAAALLPARWAWILDAAAFACFAMLFFMHVSLAPLEHGPEHEHAMHHHTPTAPGPMSLHLQGSLIAFGGAATFIVYFITRITSELARREAELAEARQRAARSEKLDALTTLAAGAAHELASPLSTIAVLARDLELTLASGIAGDEVIEDMHLIRSEVDRCRRILHSMASTAGETVGAEWVRVSVDELVRGGAQNAPPERVDLTIDAALCDRRLLVPKVAVCQAIAAVVQNAVQASPAGSRVELRAAIVDQSLTIVVQDRGTGMLGEVLRRAGEPFFTTREPGAGMGLGLFLARRVIEGMAGTLTIESEPGAGTTVVIALPLDIPAAVMV